MEELKCKSLSERSQSDKTTYGMILNIGHSGKGRTMETVKISVVSKNQREGRDEQVEHTGF